MPGAAGKAGSAMDSSEVNSSRVQVRCVDARERGMKAVVGWNSFSVRPARRLVARMAARRWTALPMARIQRRYPMAPLKSLNSPDTG